MFTAERVHLDKKKKATFLHQIQYLKKAIFMPHLRSCTFGGHTHFLQEGLLCGDIKEQLFFHAMSEFSDQYFSILEITPLDRLCSK